MLLEAKELLDAEKYPEAGELITRALKDDPDNVEALFLYGRAMLEAERPMYARLAYEHLIAREGKRRWQCWLNLGKAYDDLGWHDKAQGCFRKILKMVPDQPQATRNMGTSNVQMQNWTQAEQWATRALELNENKQSHIDRAYSWLNTGRYGEGWDEYAHGIGHMQWRDRKIYGDEPQWNGEASRVIITGEQGVGDQIAYMSCLRDATERTHATVTAIDCYPKLQKLFARTFPEIPVYGDMFKQELDWDPRPACDHSALMSLLPRFCRRTAEDYPDGVYLKPCPVRVEQWRHYLSQLPGKKIGLAWTGGIDKTGQKARSTVAETFRPLFELGATFISLEYRDPGPLPDGLAHFPWATETSDYDDTAALVANLDLVICVPTSAAHLAGALGVPCWVIQHDKPHFFFADNCRIWASVTNYHRKGDWSVIEKVAADLRRFLEN